MTTGTVPADTPGGLGAARSRRVVVALEVGAGSIRAALVDADATVLAGKSGMTPRTSSAELVEAAVLPAGRLIEQARREGLDPVGVGAAVPGIVDERLGVVRRSANLTLRDVPLREVLAERLRLPVALAQDARAAARGEALLGAGHDATDFLYMVLGDGIGSAVVLDGHPRTGAHGVAGEVGHIRVRQDAGLPCGCGGHGCAETLASIPALVQRYTLATGGLATPAQLLESVAAGAQPASGIWREAMAGLASATAAAVAVLDCDVVVLGGALAGLAGELLVRSLTAELAGRLSLVPAPALLLARLGDAAVLLGAAGAAFEAAGAPGVVETWRTRPRSGP